MEWFVIAGKGDSGDDGYMFQTKLTYGMICYDVWTGGAVETADSFKLSWLMEWFVIGCVVL